MQMEHSASVLIQLANGIMESRKRMRLSRHNVRAVRLKCESVSLFCTFSAKNMKIIKT